MSPEVDDARGPSGALSRRDKWWAGLFLGAATVGVPLAGAGVVVLAGERPPKVVRAAIDGIAEVLEARGLEQVESYGPTLRRVADASGVSRHLLGGIVFAESRGRSGQRSSAGALGLMQLVPAAARDAAARIEVELPDADDALEERLLHDDTLNLTLGAAHLNWLLEHRGEWSLEAVLVSYNAGRTRLFRWIDRHGSYADWVRSEEERAARGEPTTGALAYARQVLSARDELARRGSL